MSRPALTGRKANAEEAAPARGAAGGSFCFEAGGYGYRGGRDGDSYSGGGYGGGRR